MGRDVDLNITVPSSYPVAIWDPSGEMSKAVIWVGCPAEYKKSEGSTSNATKTYDPWVQIYLLRHICSVRNYHSGVRDTQLRARDEIRVLCKYPSNKSLYNGAEIGSDAYRVSSFDLDTVPSLERDELTILFVQFRPYLSVDRGFVLAITRYPKIFRGYYSLSDIRHDRLKIVLDRGDG